MAIKMEQTLHKLTSILEKAKQETNQKLLLKENSELKIQIEGYKKKLGSANSKLRKLTRSINEEGESPTKKQKHDIETGYLTEQTNENSELEDEPQLVITVKKDKTLSNIFMQ